MTLGAWDPCDNPTSQSLLADYYPKVQRSKVMSVYQTRPAARHPARADLGGDGDPVGLALGVLLPQHPGVHRGDPRPPPSGAGPRSAGPLAAAPRPRLNTRRCTTRCRAVRPTASCSASARSPCSRCRRRSERCSTGASARGRRRSSSATTTCRSPRRPPRSASSPSAGSPGCSSPAGSPTTSRSAASAPGGCWSGRSPG